MTRIILTMLGLIAALMAVPPEMRAEDRSLPNIVFILADDLGYGDVGCFGSRDIATPHLDALARDGAKLTSWYAQPVCTPCRYALLTGWHPNRSAGRLMNPLMRSESADDEKGLRDEETTVASLLRDKGYRTAVVGKWHLGQAHPRYLPTRHGFDSFYGHTGGCVDMFTLRYGNIPDWYRNETVTNDSGYATDVVTHEAIRYLRTHDGRQPFFLYLAYGAPHYGKHWDEKTSQSVNLLQAKESTIERLQRIPNHDRRVFAAMVVELDEAIGKVLSELDECGLKDNTWVIFASDNGGDVDFGGNNSPLRGEKNTLWEGGIRTPCVMRWPGRIKPGSVIDQPLSVLDFLPTVAALLDLPTKAREFDGIDMRPALFERKSLDRSIFFSRGGDAVFRQGNWKYLRNAGRDMLFDLTSDLGEQRDLAQQNPAKLSELKQAHAAVQVTLP